MSKICPNCQAEYDDNEDFCGRGCGARLIDKPKFLDSTINLGDANAISGGVNINQSKNITSHDTHYHSTTVHERPKSELEIQRDAANLLREKAQEMMNERGRIDSAVMGLLRPLASQLGIDDETFKSIIKEVRSNRNGSAIGLGVADARYLQQAQHAVQTNDIDVLSRLTHRLEAMASISQDDDVQYLHYLTLSLFYPIKSVEVFERQTDENYWRWFWAIISYIRSGKYAEAERQLPFFKPIRFEKSEDDRNILEAYCSIMKNDKDVAQEFLDDILGEPATQVKPLLQAIEATLYEENPNNLEVRFYMERVMAKSDVVVKSSKSAENQPTIEEPSRSNNDKNSEVKENDAERLYAEASVASGTKRVMLLQKAADAGSLDAMCDLADCYWDGEGVEKNMSLAIKWITKAADSGYAKAQAILGAIYWQGLGGLDQNYVLAEKYLSMAANMDNTDAQATLSLLYINIENYDKAVVWARRAAQMGHPLAELSLGRIYADGLGVEANLEEGLKWLEKAANHGDAEAQNMVGNIYQNADFVKNDPQKAFKHYQMAAAQGHLWGMYNLGRCYDAGFGTEVNPFSAVEWLRKAADGGIQEAIDFLNNNPTYSPSPIAEDEIGQQEIDNIKIPDATRFTDSNEDNSDLKRNCISLSDICDFDGNDVELYRSQANDGDKDAMVKIGLCYFTGSGVKQNDNLAMMWIKRAAELGDSHTAYMLGETFSQNKNLELAANCYRSAANQKYPKAVFKLGMMYMNGYGVVLNRTKAIALIQEAANLGNPEAYAYIEEQGINTYTEQQPAPYAIINNVYFTTDNIERFITHMDFELNNYGGENVFIDITFFVNKVRKWNDRVIEFDSTTFKDWTYSLHHDRLCYSMDQGVNNIKVIVKIKHCTNKNILAECEKEVAVDYQIHIFSKNTMAIIRQ